MALSQLSPVAPLCHPRHARDDFFVLQGFEYAGVQYLNSSARRTGGGEKAIPIAANITAMKNFTSLPAQ